MTARQAHNLRSIFSILAVLLVVILLIPFKSKAVDPANVITYQGRILDTNGVPVADASVDIIFRIYDSVSGGSCLWSNSSATCATTTARTVTLSSGLFSENLGDTTLATPYAAINNSVFTDDIDSAIFLDINIEGESLTPRKRLTAAPYAINAQTLDGLDSSVLRLFEVGTNGSYEDDAAVIVGTDAAFTHASGAAGDLRIADELEVIGNSYFDGNIDISLVTSAINNENITITQTHATDVNLSPLKISFVDSAATNTGDNYLIDLINANDGGATGTPDAFIHLDQSDFNESVSAGILFTDVGGGFINLIDSPEFDVSGSTGSIRIDDGGDAGQLSIEGTILDINSLDFTGTGSITAGGVININPTGNLTISLADGENVLIDGDGSPTADALTIGFGDTSSTNGVDGIYIVSNITNASGAGIHFDPAYSTNTAGQASIILVDSLTATASDGDGFDDGDDLTLSVINIGALTEVETEDEVLSAAIRIADGWDSLLETTDSSAQITIPVGGTLSFKDVTQHELLRMVADGAFNNADLYVSDDLYVTGDLEVDSNISFDLGGSESFSLDKAFADGVTENGFNMTFAGNDSGGIATQYGLYLDNVGGAQALESFLVLDNSEALQTVDVGLKIMGVDDSSYTTGMYITDSATGLSVDVSSAGNGIQINQTGTGSALSISSSGSIGNIFALSTTDTAGMLMSASFSGATELSNDLRGLNLDLGNNVSYPAAIGGIDTTGIRLALPGISETGGGTASVNGINLSSGALSATTGTGAIYWNGSYITIPAITQTGGSTIETAGYKVETGSITSGGTEYGVRIQSSGVAAGNLYGLSISNITGSTGTETGISIGTGWDIGILTQSGLAIGSQLPLTSGSTAPSVKGGSHFVTDNGLAGLTIINNFSDGFSGQLVVVEINDGNTDFDCTSSSLLCGTTDITDVADGDVFVWMYGSAGWNLLSFMDSSNNHNAGDGFDLAEYFQSTDSLLAGEVVTIDPTASAYVSRSAGETYDNMIVGVVSTDPGEILGDPSLPNSYPIALAGRVPINVTNENGTIFAGDPLTTSSTSGFAMKATKAGKIVGYALENFVGTTGQVLSFVQAEWSGNESIGTDGISTTISDTLVLTSLDTASASEPGVASQIFALRGSGWNGSAAEVLDMKIQNEVDSSSDYRLSIKNTADTEVAYITNEGTMRLAGDMIITGNIYPSDRGVAQTSKYIYYDGSIGPGGDMMRTNAAGWSTGSYDFAEMFPANESLEAGDVVVFIGDGERIGKTSTTYNKQVAGIISTRPGFLAGENKAGQFPVALAGRVPTKVNLEGGEIAVGDPLTTSSTPGYAMKASNAGMIVGYALEPFNGGNNKITVFVNSIYFDGADATSLPGISNTASQISTGRSSNFTQLNMEGGIYMGGNDILNIRRLAGIANRWTIDEDGTIKTEGTIKTIINSYQNEKIETSAITSSAGVFVTLVGTAELSNGIAIVEFEKVDPKFNDIISITAPINVIATPNGPVSLYVSQKDHNGFTINQINGSDSNISVDWMVSAYRKDFEPVVEDMEVIEITELVIVEDTIEPIEKPALPKEAPEETDTTAETKETSLEDEPAPSESPTQSSDPTVEDDGDSIEPSSSDVVSTESSAQTEE